MAEQPHRKWERESDEERVRREAAALAIKRRAWRSLRTEGRLRGPVDSALSFLTSAACDLMAAGADVDRKEFLLMAGRAWDVATAAQEQVRRGFD